MSKQLTLSAAVSLFAMMGFVLVATSWHEATPTSGPRQTGATVETAAPALDRVLVAPVDLIR